MGLAKFFTKKCAQSQVSSLWRLTWVFDGTWKNFHKKVCPVTRFFAVETILSFWWDLEKFPQKSVPSHTFLRCGDYLKFLMGLGKLFTKKCAQSHVSSLWRLSQVFGGTWKKFHKKVCPVTQSSLWRLTWVFDGTWKNFHKKVCPVTRFFAVETILSFWGDLERFDKKVWPVTRFFAVQTISSFWWDLEKISQKSVPSHTFLRCGD